MTTKTGLVDIGCLVRVAEETPMAGVRQAIALTARAGAHLSVVVVVQTYVAPYTPFWTGFSTSIANEINDKAQAQAASFAETVAAEAAAQGATCEITTIAGPAGEITERAARMARMVDLVVVDQQQGALDTTEILIEEVLFKSGRPVLIANPHAPPIAAIRKALVGWDGSSHVTRAVSDALLVFPELEAIEIVTISGEKSLDGGLPGVDFARHLARKGLDATLTELVADGRSVAAILDEQATATKVDVIVAGAFGHSRLREFLLGGVTVELTSRARSPVLMAY